MTLPCMGPSNLSQCVGPAQCACVRQSPWLRFQAELAVRMPSLYTRTPWVGLATHNSTQHMD